MKLGNKNIVQSLTYQSIMPHGTLPIHTDAPSEILASPSIILLNIICSYYDSLIDTQHGKDIFFTI